MLISQDEVRSNWSEYFDDPHNAIGHEKEEDVNIIGFGGTTQVVYLEIFMQEDEEAKRALKNGK